MQQDEQLSGVFVLLFTKPGVFVLESSDFVVVLGDANLLVAVEENVFSACSFASSASFLVFSACECDFASDSFSVAIMTLYYSIYSHAPCLF